MHEVFFIVYSNVNLVVYSSLPVYSSSFKALASIVFEIFCRQDCIHIFSNGHNSGKGHNQCVTYFFMRNSYMIFKTVACRVLKLCYASKSMTDGWMNRQTDERPRSNMPLQLLRSWGHNKLSHTI